MSEIIIDGVNVAECRHFKYDSIKKPICRSGGCRGVYKNCLCEGNDDCYYKQLKRLQAENEELKAKFNNNSLCNRIQIYEADEARMRKALEEIKEMVDEPCVPTEKDCLACPSNCFTKDILIKINEVLKDERN